MATGFYSTPAFELFRRGLISQTIKRFKGIDQYTTRTQLSPDYALDCLNVVVSGSGGLEKLRLPVVLSAAIGGQIAGPNSFWDFQQANLTRQVVANFGQSLYFFTNDLAIATLIETQANDAGPWSAVEANNILFMANGQRMRKWTGANWWAWGHPSPAVAPVVGALVAGTLTLVTGREYGYAYTNGVTGHIGAVSPATVSTGAIANKAIPVTALASADPQIDTISWYATLDGGGDLFHLADVNIATSALTNVLPGVSIVVSGAGLVITDQSPDTALDQTQRAALFNHSPPVAKYLAAAPFQGRIYGFNLAGAPQQGFWTGYEQILNGRPEESVPPNNRFQLAIGAEQIAGGGVIQPGIVAFSNTGKMWMLRGAVQDIVITAPVQFTAFLQELPWTLGCFSHYSIASTPHGLVWLAGDKTVQIFDGAHPPQDISANVYPILRTMTPGTESSVVGGYFNWLERDWYVLACAIGGSLLNNRIFAFDLEPSRELNAGVFVFNIEADFIGIVTTSKLQRLLCISQGGIIKQLTIGADTVGGITDDLTIKPATAGQLNAYWRSGYFGAEQPQRSKMWRWGEIVTDQDPASFTAQVRYTDDRTRTAKQPEIIQVGALANGRIPMGRRALRASIEIDFPATDAPANVLELTVARIDTSDRK